MRTDAGLLPVWRNGDPSAGEALFDRHADAVAGCVHDKLTHGVEDLVQQTFVRRLEGVDRLRSATSSRAFLFAIAHNLSRETFPTRDVALVSTSGRYRRLVAILVIHNTVSAMNADSPTTHIAPTEPVHRGHSPLCTYLRHVRGRGRTLRSCWRRMMKRCLPLLATLSAFTTLGSGCDRLDPDVLGGVQWAHGAPRFADFDGDGVLDPFGWVHEWKNDLYPRIAAYSGKTGDRLWITPVLGALGEAHTGRMGLVDNTLIVVDSGGTARAFRPGEDTPLWATALEERADAVCSAGPGQVVVRTVDGQAQVLELASGASQPTTPPAQCTRDELAPQIEVRTPFEDFEKLRNEPLFPRKRRKDDTFSRDRVPHLSPAAAIDVSPNLQILLGSRTEGTRVPMVAVLRGGALAWSSVVPAEAPLRADGLVEGGSVADDRAVFVGYGRGQVDRVAAFAVADGQRLWDIGVPMMPESPDRIDAVALTPDRLYIAHFTHLSAFDRETGELLHTIGQRR